MSDQHHHETNPTQLPIYEIRVEGHLGGHWTGVFEGLDISLEDSGDTLLTGTVVDQAALHGVLRRIRDTGMTLISVRQLSSSRSYQSNSKSHNQERGIPMATRNGTMEQGTQMKVLVFGATGTTGSAVVERALERGYTVTAFVRNPEKVTTRHPNLTVVQGDVLDPDSVERAVQGHDAVVSSLGAGLKGTVRSEGTRNVIRAMQQAHVQRLISQSTLGVDESRTNLNAYWKYIMFGMLLRRAYADHIQQEQYIKQSHLDWTIVRPAALTDGTHTGSYRHGFSASARDLTLDISVADVADFMVQQLEDDTYLHGTPGLSY